MKDDFSIINKTRSNLPSIPFACIKNDILGENYSLSLAFLTREQIKKINKTYRHKNKPTNILSFCISKNSGEILICPAIVKSETKSSHQRLVGEAKKSDRTFREWLGFLVIHGMLHLKGMKHSSRMEKAEERYDKKYFYRNRPRVYHNKSLSGRIFKRRKKS